MPDLRTTITHVCIDHNNVVMLSANGRVSSVRLRDDAAAVVLRPPPFDNTTTVRTMKFAGSTDDALVCTVDDAGQCVVWRADSSECMRVQLTDVHTVKCIAVQEYRCGRVGFIMCKSTVIAE